MNWGWDPSCLGKLKSCRDNGAACAPGLGFGGALQTNPASRWLRAGGGSPKSSGSAADPAPARLGGLSKTRGSLPAHRCPCFPGEGGGFRAGFATPAELLGARGGDNNALPPKSHPPDPLKLGGQSCTSQRSSHSMLLPPPSQTSPVGFASSICSAPQKSLFPANSEPQTLLGAAPAPFPDIWVSLSLSHHLKTFFSRQKQLGEGGGGSVGYYFWAWA